MPSSRDIIQEIEADGWVLVATRGSHQLKHPVKPGKVTVPHPKKDRPAGTVRSIRKQAGLDEEALHERGRYHMRYVALIHKDPDSCYGVTIPDVPGCFSAGDTLDEAIRNATEAVALHLEDEAELPAPRSVDEIGADPDLVEEREGVLLVAVPFVRDRGSVTRVNISLDRGLLEAIDEAAKSRRMTRSAFLASAARNEIANG